MFWIMLLVVVCLFVLIEYFRRRFIMPIVRAQERAAHSVDPDGDSGEQPDN